MEYARLWRVRLPFKKLTAAHAVAAVVAQVAIAISYCDRSAVVAGWGVLLEGGELFAADGGAFSGDR